MHQQCHYPLPLPDDTDNLDLVDRSPSRGEDVDVSDVHVGGSVHATLREKFGAIIATIQGIKLTSRADVDEAVHRLQVRGCNAQWV